MKKVLYGKKVITIVYGVEENGWLTPALEGSTHGSLLLRTS